MCGIVAVISKKAYGFTAKDLTVFEQMLYADALRGEDSTGVIGADKYGDMYIDKSAQTSNDFLLQYINSKSHKDMQKDGIVLIGHNRKGTVGKISDETAHPFVVNDHFAMVHNGTLYNHEQLHKTNVDSEALAMHIEGTINNDYTADKFSDAMAKVWGAYACVWYNQPTNTVQFIRNDQRPLWLCEGDDAWYLASEGSLLHWILTRNGVKYKDLNMIPVNTLHTLEPGVTKPVAMEVIEEKKAPPTITAGVVVGTNTNNTKVTAVGTDTNRKGISFSEMSKNKFKKLNKRLQNRRVEFFIDDYVEKHLFQTKDACEEFIVMGATDELEHYKHTIRGVVNIRELNILDIDSIDNYYFSGTISHVTYDPRLKQIDIHVTDIAKLPPSIPTITTKVIDEETSVTLH